MCDLSSGLPSPSLFSCLVVYAIVAKSQLSTCLVARGSLPLLRRPNQVKNILPSYCTLHRSHRFFGFTDGGALDDDKDGEMLCLFPSWFSLTYPIRYFRASSSAGPQKRATSPRLQPQLRNKESGALQETSNSAASSQSAVSKGQG